MEGGSFEPSVMTLARLENDRNRFKAIPKPGRESAASRERVSDAWPGWSTDLSAAELAKGAEKNRPSVVLREAAGAVIYSVGLVILLMTILSLLHAR
jgi:hypothetical protein